MLTALTSRLLLIAGALATGVMLSGCASTNEAARAALNPDTPERQFATGDAFLAKGRYEDAAKKFEDLDRDHPYSPEARRALALSAYAYYRAGKIPEAITNGQRYTSLHPGTKEAALAHFVIASSYFEEIRSPDRDQSSTRKALAEFKILKARYPDSTYSKDVDNKIRICEDSLAASEMVVARQQLLGKNYAGAISRFKVVASEYQTTAHVEEALMRLTEAYMLLGIKNEAQNAAAVLGHNFPDSQWYKDAYALLQSDGLAPREQSDSWLSKTWKGVKLPKLSLNGQ